MVEASFPIRAFETPAIDRPTIVHEHCGRVGAAAAAVADAVVVIPVFNEESAVLDVLDGVERAGYRSLVLIDDGSTDASPGLLDAWGASRPWARVVHLPENQGKSAALRAGWDALRTGLEAGVYCEDTVVVCVDADGQHDLHQLETLLARLRALPADVVIAQRDLGYHGWYKRIGNHVMAALGSLCAGVRIHDIESGYRLVRLGPLLHAQEFYAGRRYSEGVELAVVLGRLGYRVDNDYIVQVPIPRTRTHLSDAANHAATMLGAWFRTVSWRDVLRVQRSLVATCVAAVLCAGFALFMAVLLVHRFYLGNDSAQSYGHVWAIAHALSSGHGIPLRIEQLELGHAFTFPYALVPWLPTALLSLVLGEWAVTLTMGVGVALLLLGLWLWLPRTATPLVTGMLLLNWQLWNGVLQFQLPTIWAFAFACLAAAAFDRGRPRTAVALATLAMVAHPLLGAAALGLTLLAHIESTRSLPVCRIALLALATLLAAPAVWMFLQTPSMAVAGAWSWRTPATIIAQRTSMLWWPWLVQRSLPLVLMRRAQVPLLVLGALLLVRNVWGSNPQNIYWSSLPRFPDYIGAHLVAPEVHYRVLTMSNQEDGMTQLMQAGAHLAQDYFDESVARHSFGDTATYRCFLAAKGADRVLVQGEWIRRGTSNEVQRLTDLVTEGNALLTYQGAAGTREYTITAAPPVDCAPTASRK